MSKKEKTICQTCDKEFSYYRSTLRGKDAKYCSRDCIQFEAWNKGKYDLHQCAGCDKMIRTWRKYCSPDCYYENNDMSKRLPDTTKGELNGCWKGGKPKCNNCGKTLSIYNPKYTLCFDCVWEECSGENHPLWKGGPEDERNKIRKSREYRIWRKAVFLRDDYTCQICDQRGCYLEADHIKPFSKYPELRLAIDNGRTLCKQCHIKYGWKRRK